MFITIQTLYRKKHSESLYNAVSYFICSTQKKTLNFISFLCFLGIKSEQGTTHICVGHSDTSEEYIFTIRKIENKKNSFIENIFVQLKSFSLELIFKFEFV